MSALNVTQDEADLLLTGLNMYADVQRNASGSVPDDVKALISKITPAPVVEAVVESAPVVEAVAEPEVVVEAPVVEAKEDEKE